MKKLFYFLVFALLAFSCSKDETEEVPEFDITSDYYFVALIDGEKIQFEYNIDGYVNAPVSGGSTTPAGYQYYDGTVFLKGISTSNSVGLIVLKTFSDSPWCDQIMQMYHTGSYNFGMESLSTDENGKDGVVVYYVDGNGVQWSSGYQPANQSESSFEITEYKDLPTFYSSKMIKAKFSCTLYNQSGESKKLTNGEVQGVCVSCSN